jgi:hypothetical protein
MRIRFLRFSVLAADIVRVSYIHPLTRFAYTALGNHFQDIAFKIYRFSQTLSRGGHAAESASGDRAAENAASSAAPAAAG